MCKYKVKLEYKHGGGAIAGITRTTELACYCTSATKHDVPLGKRCSVGLEVRDREHDLSAACFQSTAHR